MIKHKTTFILKLLTLALFISCGDAQEIKDLKAEKETLKKELTEKGLKIEKLEKENGDLAKAVTFNETEKELIQQLTASKESFEKELARLSAGELQAVTVILEKVKNEATDVNSKLAADLDLLIIKLRDPLTTDAEISPLITQLFELLSDRITSEMKPKP